MCLTVGELKSCLLFLLARSGSCFRFDIGQLLWFHPTWKNSTEWNSFQRFFAAVKLYSLSCQKEESNVELGEESDTDRLTSGIFKEIMIITLDLKRRDI